MVGSIACRENAIIRQHKSEEALCAREMLPSDKLTTLWSIAVQCGCIWEGRRTTKYRILPMLNTSPVIAAVMGYCVHHHGIASEASHHRGGQLVLEQAI